MNSSEIYPRLTAVFREQFNDPNLEIGEHTSSADILDWDSLAHIRLIIAVEAEFSCQFDTDELGGLTEVGDLVKAISTKLAA